MIDFSLTDEQKALQELARDFAQKEIVPVATELDRTGQHQVDRRGGELEVALDDDRVGDGAIQRALATVILGVGRRGVEPGVDADGVDGQRAGAERGADAGDR